MAPIVALMLAAATAAAQELEGRSRIELQVGAAIAGGTTTASVGSIVSETQSVAPLGAQLLLFTPQVVLEALERPDPRQADRDGSDLGRNRHDGE